MLGWGHSGRSVMTELTGDKEEEWISTGVRRSFEKAFVVTFCYLLVRDSNVVHNPQKPTVVCGVDLVGANYS